MLGVLFGVCIRSNPVVCVDLPAIVWKTLVGQRITLADVEEFDEGLLEMIKRMLNADKAEFDELFEDRFFTTTLSAGGATVELEEGGQNRALTLENRLEYARKVLYTRITESSKQCEAIRQGICTIVPEALLNMVTFAELEEWVYGRKFIDADLLERHTTYGGTYAETEPRPKQIKWFWDWFKAQPQDVRRKFIQFCLA
jgi:E3 ubiquitin-protein ligase HECTD3